MNELQKDLRRLQNTAFAIGGIFLLISGVGLACEPRTAFISYLFSFIFWLCLALGCFLLAMIHYLIGGDWGNVTRRFFEAGYMTLPMLAVLLIPLFFGLRELYPWADPAQVASDHILKQKAGYDNLPMFLLRAIVFFSISISLAARLRHWSLKEVTTSISLPALKLRTISGPAVVIVPFLATFFLIDWAMSIERAWYSTIFPVILLAGGILTALALAIILLAWFQARPPFQDIVTEKHFLDFGNLLLTFVMFWTYVAFSQWLVNYSGNQPREIGWYLSRTAGGWKWLITFVIIFHFFVPFFVLLFRSAKQNLRLLTVVAALILAVNVLGIFWMVAPTFYPQGLQVHWTDFTAWLGISGMWAGVFLFNLTRHSLLPKPMPLETLMELAPHEN